MMSACFTRKQLRVTKTFGYPDSGTSMHMIFSGEVLTPEVKTLSVIHTGTVMIREQLNGDLVVRELQKFFFCNRTLFSSFTINDQKFRIHAHENHS